MNTGPLVILVVSKHNFLDILTYLGLFVPDQSAWVALMTFRSPVGPGWEDWGEDPVGLENAKRRRTEEEPFHDVRESFQATDMVIIGSLSNTSVTFQYLRLDDETFRSC